MLNQFDNSVIYVLDKRLKFVVPSNGGTYQLACKLCLMIHDLHMSFLGRWDRSWLPSQAPCHLVGDVDDCYLYRWKYR